MKTGNVVRLPVSHHLEKYGEKKINTTVVRRRGQSIIIITQLSIFLSLWENDPGRLSFDPGTFWCQDDTGRGRNKTLPYSLSRYRKK